MNESLQKNLRELDFPPHDAVVYTALLEKGPCTAGPLITAIGLHRNVVYTSLDHLVFRKLVSEKVMRGRKHFTATAPNALAEEYEKKFHLASETSETIGRMLAKGIQEITVHQGNEEYLALLTSIIKTLPKGATKYVLGTGDETFMANTMRPIWKEYHRVAHAQKLKIRMLAYEPQRMTMTAELEAEGVYNVRYLPSEIENPSGIHIYPEAGVVLNIIYSDDTTPVTAIKIRHETLVKGYQQLFESLWRMGKR